MGAATNVILFATISNQPTPLRRVAAAGGTPTDGSTLAPGDSKHVRPSFLPDGRHFVYRMLGTVMRGAIMLGALDTAERRQVVEADATNVSYSSGHLLFLRDSTLMALPMTTDTYATRGEPFPIVDSIQAVPSAGTAYAMFSASENGVLAYEAGAATLPQLSWIDRAGKLTAAAGQPGAFSDLELSPDGTHATVSILDGARSTRDIWLVDLARGVRSRFTFDPSDEESSVWSPDGTRIAFNSRRRGHRDLYVKNSSGADAEELLFADELEKWPTSWSPDGRFLLYMTTTSSSSLDHLMALPLQGDRKPVRVIATAVGEGLGRFSPDGRWIAYISNEWARGNICHGVSRSIRQMAGII